MAGTKGGGLNGRTVQESNNAALGQGGSMFIDDTQTYTPPAGQVFISIQFITSTIFVAAATGLAAQNSGIYISTVDSGNGAASTSSPPGQLIDASNSFPAGATIHGRWTSIDLVSGSLIAYLGS